MNVLNSLQTREEKLEWCQQVINERNRVNDVRYFGYAY